MKNNNLIKGKKSLIFFMIFLLILQMTQAFTLGNKVFADDFNDFPFITDISLNDENGNSYDLSQKRFNKDDKIHINFKFKIKDEEKISSGQKYKIKVPEEFNIKDIKITSIKTNDKSLNQNEEVTTGSSAKIDKSNNVTTGSGASSDVYYDQNSEDNQSKITINQSNNTNELIVQFENTKEIDSVVTGEFYVDAEFNSEKIGNATSKTIAFTANNKTIKKFDVKFADGKEIDFPFITGVYLSADEFKGDIDIGKDDFKNRYGDYLKELEKKEIDKESQMFIGYTFNIPQDQEVKAGQTFTIDIPKVFTIPKAMSQDIIDTDGIKIGIANITTDNRVTITFSDGVNTELSGIDGNFWFGAALNKSEIENENSGNITFKTSYFEDKTFNINFKKEDFKEEEPTITKNGQYSPDDQTINWTIEATAGNLDRENFTISDQLDSTKHTYISGTLKVDGASVDDSSFTENNLNYNFGTVAKSEKKVIEFKTKPNDNILNSQGSSNYIDNKATLKIDNKPDISAQKTVEVKNDYLYKSGYYNSSNKSIEWTIETNKSKIEFNNPIVTDVLPEGLTLKADSVTLDGKNLNSSDYSYDEGTRTFTYKLPSDSLNHTIKFSTAIDSKILQDTFKETHIFNNTVELDVNSQHFEYGAHGVNVGDQNDMITKKATDYNKATKEITWQIKVNTIDIKIDNAKVIEYIDKHQEYVEGSLFINNNSSGSIKEVVSENPWQYPKKYEISLGNISGPQTITLKTRITDDDILYNNNWIWASDYCKLLGDNIKNYDATGTFGIDGVLIRKDGSYDYTNREITWTVEVNQAQIHINDAKVVDNIKKGQEYVDGSFSIERTAGTSDAAVSVSNKPSYSKATSDDNEKSGVLTYDFGGTISDKYKITFKTKISSDKEFNKNSDINVNNEVFLKTSSTNKEIKASKDITIKNYLISKNFSYNWGDDFITWKININKNNIKLDNMKVIDTLPDGLQIDMDSVKLYELQSDSYGNQTTKSEVNSNEYKASYDSVGRDFVLEYPNSTDKSYLITFDTLVKTSGTTFRNKVKLESDTSGSNNDSEIESSQVYFTISGASAYSTSGGIVITKVNKDEQTLSGAQFVLIKDGKIAQTSEPTGDDGKATFKRIAFEKEYIIKEIKAPYGYKLSDEEYKFTITKSSDLSQNLKQYNFVDEKFIKNIEFQKNNENNEPLKGAEFELYASTDTSFSNPLKTATSDENGLVRFEGVELGDYKIKETKAPDEYFLSNTVINVKVDETGSSGNTIKTTPNIIKDDLVKKSIQLYKKSDLNTPLSGATFSLYKESDTDFKDPIQTIISDIQGIVTFTDVGVGNYVIKETIAPAGYVISDSKITANVDNTGKASDIVKATPYEIENTIKPVEPEKPEFVAKDITVIKQSTDGKSLSGAEFSLYNAEDTNFVAPLETATSDENGIVKFVKVQPGAYVIKETKAPEGYELSDETLNVVENDFANNEIPTIEAGTVTNTEKEVVPVEPEKPEFVEKNITVIKQSTDGKSLSGAEFSLYNAEDTSFAVPLETATSDENGIAKFVKVQPGVYVIKETKAPEGYELSDKTLNIVENDFANNEIPTIEAGTVTNTKKEIVPPAVISKTIEITKKSPNDNLLKGAEFSLYNAEDTSFKTVLKTAVSDATGIARFEVVEPGNYIIKETKAPQGYYLSDKILNIVKDDFISNGKDTISAGTVIDKKRSSSSGHKNNKDDTPTSDSSSTVDNSNTNTGTKGDVDNKDTQNNNTNTPNEFGNNSGTLNETSNITENNNTDSYLETEETPAKDSNSNNKKQSEKLPQAGRFIDFPVLIVLGLVFIVLGFTLRFKKEVHSK